MDRKKSKQIIGESLSQLRLGGKMCGVQFRVTSSNIYRLALISLSAGALAFGVAIAPPVAVPVKAAFGHNPLLFLSERKDLHIGTRRAHANFLKVVQSDQYQYGERTEGGDAIIDRDEFYEKLDQAHGKSHNAPIVVFVHGCCVSFGEQMLQANDLEKALDTSSSTDFPPVTLSYDWAAPFSYNSSLEHAYVAQKRFDGFMADLVKRYGADHIIIVAHSLGTLMVQNYTRQIGEDLHQSPFQAIVFSRADVDRAAFADCLPALKKYSQRLIVLCSTNDPNIYFSGMLRKMGIRFAQAAVLPAKLPLVKPLGAAQSLAPGSPKGQADANGRVAAAGDEAEAALPEDFDGAAEKTARDASLVVIGKNYNRLGQTKVARKFASTIEVYDMSSLRLGHGIPYKFIADLLTNNMQDFALRKGSNGLQIVHRARP
jgi:pimeloyl-ACP methyl ester carboxylesterase